MAFESILWPFNSIPVNCNLFQNVSNLSTERLLLSFSPYKMPTNGLY